MLCFFVFPNILFTQTPQSKTIQHTKTSIGQEDRRKKEQLAYQFFNEKDYEKAKPLFLELYGISKYAHFFNQYIECLFALREYELAEKQLSKLVKEDSKNWRARIDYGYTFLLQGQQRKAERVFNAILENLSSDKNSINNIGAIFRVRGLYGYAILVYEKGAAINNESYPFYLEIATIYQSNRDLEKAFDYYMLHLEQNPDQINVIKSRLQLFLIRDIDNSINDLFRDKLLKITQEKPDNQVYTEFFIWLALQQKDYELAIIQAQAFDRRFGNYEASIFEFSQIAFDNEQYEAAEEGFQYLVDKGHENPFYAIAFTGLIQTKYYLAKENRNTPKTTYQTLAKQIEKNFEQVGLNRETFDLAMIYAQILSFELHDYAKAYQLINDVSKLKLERQQEAVLKMTFADLYLLQDEVWEATLLYSQVDKSMKNEPIGHEARFRNAKLRYYIGEFNWAQTQLKILKASVSKLTANDALSLSLLISDVLNEDTTTVSLRKLAHADLLLYQQKIDEADRLLDSLWKTQKQGAIVPHLFLRKADIAEQKGNYTRADSLYKSVFTNFPDSYLADDALIRSGILNETILNKKDIAIERYELLIDEYASSIYVATARRKYRSLRDVTK
jgi:tetratricopeptide (TPR) repeat protein